ncbi:BadF/BadG/BcrA/BcrD ATPase family protein (plasmid) [Roseobacteraceae bacterium NS-SX3]
MLNLSQNPVIAADGGGTTCRIVFADGGQQLAIEAGPANVTSDFEGAVARIAAGLERLAEQLGVPLAALAPVPAYLGLAGVTGPQIAGRVAAALPLAAVRVEDDRHAALAGAHGGRDGAIAHCGTGSFLALQSQGRRRFAGGWGPVLGDPASAQWIGRKALAAVLEAQDRLAHESGLTAALLQEYGGTDGIVAFAAGARPEEFGQIARQVTAAAAAGDGVAAALMRHAAGRLLKDLEKMGWTPAMPLCLTGGIGPHYAAYLPVQARAALAPPAGSPLEGAIALAKAFAAEQAA